MNIYVQVLFYNHPMLVILNWPPDHCHQPAPCLIHHSLCHVCCWHHSQHCGCCCWYLKCGMSSLRWRVVERGAGSYDISANKKAWMSPWQDFCFSSALFLLSNNILLILQTKIQRDLLGLTKCVPGILWMKNKFTDKLSSGQVLMPGITCSHSWVKNIYFP